MYFFPPAYAQGAGGGDPVGFLIPMVLMIVVFYFLLIRPQQKRAKEHRQMISALRRGDKVVTAGGILGKVARAPESGEVEVEIAEGVRVKVVRDTISQVITKSAPPEGAPPPAANEDSKKSGGLLGGLFKK
ncbi:MAG: preprotein translocase subunit YajC [Alphaproteobacteria bacterium]